MLDDAKLIDIIEPVVSAAGFTLYDAEFRGASLLVMVDGPDGINLDQVASISRTISRHLDEDDPIPGKYTLEVSTPGLERRLRRSDHFLGAIGESVKVKLNPGTAGERRRRRADRRRRDLRHHPHRNRRRAHRGVGRHRPGPYPLRVGSGA